LLFVPTAPRYGNLAHLAICWLQQYGRSSHRHDDHDGAHYQPSSPPSPCPCRPIVLLLRVVCGALGCPARLFFLLGFLRVSHSLPLGYGAGVVVALAVCAHPHGARSAGICCILGRHPYDSARIMEVWRNGVPHARESLLCSCLASTSVLSSPERASIAPFWLWGLFSESSLLPSLDLRLSGRQSRRRLPAGHRCQCSVHR
jgi:hypothetical protein